MQQFLVVFEILDRAVAIPLELVLQRVQNHFADRDLISSERDFFFPIVKNGVGYSIDIDENSGWEIICNQQRISAQIPLKHGDYIEVRGKQEGYFMLAVQVEKSSLNTRNYKLPDQGNIFLGRSSEMNIVIDINHSVSRKHAAIHIEKNGIASVEDISRKAGVYLNGKRIESAPLHCGDQIMVMGITVIYMGTYLIVPEKLQVNGMEYIHTRSVAPERSEEVKSFSRKPRIFKSVIDKEIVIASPPQQQRMKPQPFLLSVGPSLTMSLAMLISVGVTISNIQQTGNYTSAITGGVMAVSMMMGAIFWPILSNRYRKKQNEKEEQYRIQRYTGYLQKKEEYIAQVQEYNGHILNKYFYPEPQTLLEYAVEKKRHLWEKTPQDVDFLSLRLGTGKGSFLGDLKIPEKEFVLYEDPLLDQAIEVGQRYSTSENLPVTVSLRENRTIGIVGDWEKLHQIIRCMTAGLCIAHSPDEVKLAFVMKKDYLDQYQWLLQLPHIWSDDRTVRYVMTEKSEVEHGCELLEEEIHTRLEQEENDRGKERTPHYVFFILDRELIEKRAIYRYLCMPENNSSLSAVFVSDQFDRLPRECSTIIQAEYHVSGIYLKNRNDNRFTEFDQDEFTKQEAERMSRALGEISAETTKSRGTIPERITFLEMYHAGNVEELGIESRWKTYKTSLSLAAPVGVSAGNTLFSLDIHEKYHGCHGLVAGMTGSGKSEFLQAYIASMMLNYSPDKVSFVLIDFKGGDMARPFLNSPHLAATISNLSGNMLYRARVSLEAEIKRRQRLFNRTAAQLETDKIDINSYQAYYEQGKLNVPLQHLIIVIDEFAQLKTQHQEFMEYLINVAQVGRSLGIHLILATQKPAGVVDGQIWSNSRFRVCLKVQDRQDSSDMLGKPEAAAIRQPGRAYVQVGYNEVYEQIQSGYSGAEYVRKQHYQDPDADTVILTDFSGRTISRGRDVENGYKTGKTQLEEVTAEISKIAGRLNLHADLLWLAPLPELLVSKEEVWSGNSQWDKDCEYSVVCGLCDQPERQRQIPYTISFPQMGHMAVYGSSSTGKTMFLHMMMFRLAMKYSPLRVQIYVLDFGGRSLGLLSKMPHTAGIAFADEEDKAQRIIKEVADLMERRKEILAESGYSTFQAYIQEHPSSIPAVFLIIDNYAAFRERMFRLEDEIVQLAANASTYGIYLVLTGNSKNAIYYKVAEHISNRLVFRMNDSMNYRDLLNTGVPLEPDNIKGRGITFYQGLVSEVQISLAYQAENEAHLFQKISDNYEKMRQQYQQTVRLSFEMDRKEEPEIFDKGKKSISENEEYSLPPAEPGENTLLLGKGVKTERYYGFRAVSMGCMFLGVRHGSNIQPIFKEISNVQGTNIVWFDKGKVDTYDGKVIHTADEIEEFIVEIKNALSKQQPVHWLFVIREFSDFYDEISDDTLKELEYILSDRNQKILSVITIGEFGKIEAYRDTSLFIYLIRCEKGMIMEGNISNAMTTLLHNNFSSINPFVRQEKLPENQAFLYDGIRYAIVELPDNMRDQQGENK